MFGVLAEWSVVSLVVAALAVGLGLGLERISGRDLPTALLMPVGMAALVMVAQLAHGARVTGGLAAGVVLLLAVTGLFVGWRSGRPRRAALAGVLAIGVVWLIYVGVVAATGQATFGGYNQLADTAIHLVGADVLPGRPSVGALGDGSFAAFYDGYYRTGYPTAGASTLGTLDALLGRGPVDTLQPLLALCMAALAAACWVIITPLVALRWQRGVIVVLAPLSILTFSFVLQASLKEVLTIAFLATACAALPARGAEPSSRWLIARSAVPAGIAAAALIASIGLAGVVYLAPAAAFGGLAYARAAGWRAAALAVIAALGVALVLSVPTLLEARSYLNVAGSVLTSQTELGNLRAARLPTAEVLGVWLGPDFRIAASWPVATDLAAGVIALLVLVGAGATARTLLRNREAAVGAIAWLGATGAGTVAVLWVGSPWADAKGLAIAGSAVIAAAGIGVAALWHARAGRVVGALAALVAVGAVAGSAAYATGGVAAAPADRFAELESVNERFQGQGLMVTAEFEEFDRHLLRDVPAIFAGDPFRGLSGSFAPGVSGDQDDFELAGLVGVRQMLVRSGPNQSRPPSDYRPVWQGRFYEVWQRDPQRPTPRLHQRFGDRSTGGVEQPACGKLRELALRAAAGEQLVAAVRPAPVTQPFSTLPLPTGWVVEPAAPQIVRPHGRGQFIFTLAATPSSRVDVWMEGSYTRAVRVTANAQAATLGPAALNPRGSATRVLTTTTTADGTVRIRVDRPAGGVRPGTNDLGAVWGSLSLTPHDPLGALTQLVRLKPSDAGRLCGRSLDWVELVPAGG